MEKFDVVVVGAGPGGSIAAKAAAESGLRVLVLERGAKPGEKNVSGTGLSPKCWRDLPFMRDLALPHMRLADQATLHLVDARNRELFNFTFSAAECASYEEARRFLTMDVYRSELDPWLAGLAAAAGAEIRTGVLVRAVARAPGGAVAGVRRQIELCEGVRREFQAHLFPMLGAPPPTVADSVLLVGDAAGFACPLEAEGVYYAMLSGRFAGETAREAIDRGDLSTAGLSGYERRWRASGIGAADSRLYAAAAPLLFKHFLRPYLEARRPDDTHGRTR